MDSFQSRMNYVNSNYETLTYIAHPSEKQFIGDKEVRQCRFCGKKKGEVTFKKKAHTIPEFTGNKVIFSYDECDSCNQLFSEIETHFGNFTSFYRSAAGIKGKRGIPTFKREELEIRHTENGFQAAVTDSSVLDVEKKEFTLEATGDSFIPISVYKCLVKIGLSLLPKEELVYFEDTIRWILEKDPTKFLPGFPLKMFNSFYPGPRPFPLSMVLLLRRKMDSKDDVPYLQSILCFGNHAYQVFLPWCERDKVFAKEKKQILFSQVPMYNEETEFGKVKIKLINMSGTDKVKAQATTITYSVDRIEEKGIDEDNLPPE